MPAEYLVRDRVLAHTPEPWISRLSRDGSVIIVHQPLLAANDVIASVMHHRDGSTPHNAKLLLAGPRLLRMLSKLHDACQDLRIDEGTRELLAAMIEAGELLAEMEARP
jgi:hypothetical protein